MIAMYFNENHVFKCFENYTVVRVIYLPCKSLKHKVDLYISLWPPLLTASTI